MSFREKVERLALRIRISVPPIPAVVKFCLDDDRMAMRMIDAEFAELPKNVPRYVIVGKDMSMRKQK